jgi:hypothetical protein
MSKMPLKRVIDSTTGAFPIGPAGGGRQSSKALDNDTTE